VTRAIVAVLIAAAFVSAAQSGVVYVDADGGGDCTAIQEGLDAASGCDTVLVAPGIYMGPGNRDLTFGGKNLVVMSEAGREVTIIDCQGLGRAFEFAGTGQDTISVISGFWIRNGYATPYHGGGIWLQDANLKIVDCLISDCEASASGGGLYSGYGDVVVLENCVFQNNHAPFRGGGAMIDHCGARIRMCLFTGNTADGSGFDFDGGGALHLNWVDDSAEWCEVLRCTFTDNYAAGNGSGVLAWNSQVRTSIANSIISFNRGPGLGFYYSPNFNDLVFSNIYGNEGGQHAGGFSALIDGDPRFCDMAGGDFSLCSNSPCLPDNNSYTVLAGFGAEGCPDCDSPVEGSSWGRVKSLFR
jgi:hypothetical protein